MVAVACWPALLSSALIVVVDVVATELVVVEVGVVEVPVVGREGTDTDVPGAVTVGTVGQTVVTRGTQARACECASGTWMALESASPATIETPSRPAINPRPPRPQSAFWRRPVESQFVEVLGILSDEKTAKLDIGDAWPFVKTPGKSSHYVCLHEVKKSHIRCLEPAEI